MGSIIEKDQIICGSCGLKFERKPGDKHCSNCVVCSGCEIYYCSRCDNEIVVTPIKPIKSQSGSKRA